MRTGAVFSYGDLDGFPPLLSLKRPDLSLQLIRVPLVPLALYYPWSISEFEADLLWTDSAELDPASSLSLPGLAMDSVSEGTGTGLPYALVPLVVLWTRFNSGLAKLSPSLGEATWANNWQPGDLPCAKTCTSPIKRALETG